MLEVSILTVSVVPPVSWRHPVGTVDLQHLLICSLTQAPVCYLLVVQAVVCNVHVHLVLQRVHGAACPWCTGSSYTMYATQGLRAPVAASQGGPAARTSSVIPSQVCSFVCVQ